MSAAELSVTSSPTSARSITRHVVTGVWVVAGAMLLSSAMLRWTESGIGSQLGGLELADNIRAGVLSPSWGVWVAVALYSIIACGGGCIATAIGDHLAVVAARGVVSIAGLLVFVAIARSAIPVTDWALGSTLAALSFLIATTLTVVQLALHFGSRS